MIEHTENITFIPLEVTLCFSPFRRTPAGIPTAMPSNSASSSASTVTVSRRVFQHLLDQSPTPERCMEEFHLQRTRFELIVERKLRRRQLTDDRKVEITGRDLREKIGPAGQGNLLIG
jgi:hypothetical protein